MASSTFQRLDCHFVDDAACVEYGSESLGIRSAAASVCGGRDYNEDRVYRCDRSQVYLVADGMGGHHGGAMASQIAVETIPSVWRNSVFEHTLTYSGIQAAYGNSLDWAVGEMSAVARKHCQYEQMGCTLAAAFVYSGRMYYGNIGDCRVYLLQRNKLMRLTKDETLVQNMVDAGIISADEARSHRWRHIVTNGISVQGFKHSPRLRSAQIAEGDLVMLTSDGLTDELTDDEIEQIMRSCSDPQACVDQLIMAAIDREARDNVSCVVFQT
ncbi:Serine/threonine phosphatase stp [Stieleria maiorica]|uniref:Serine/threonine phosphatase stp n=1 Tax=Stieleria maiorica TaxID=2795974 RepID=A0A5B9MIG7_9BACT|nr:protein phosphatase 2C domain-containing protein [Stieleria maiorica]QEG00989.1 Serine/threonine phosphatase stp [Stieleria maiorica]